MLATTAGTIAGTIAGDRRKVMANANSERSGCMKSVVDFHTHVLPQVDDGSASIEESLALLRMEAEQGIRQVVATPHFYAQVDAIKPFLERRTAALSRLREAMQDDPTLPQLSIGAEVHYFSGIGKADILEALAIDNGYCVMIEMPMREWTDQMYWDLENIHQNFGLVPIVAHIDRYISPLNNHGIPERLMELPVIVQANASFFQRFSTRGLALRMLEKRQIHLIGSDCHNLNYRPVNIKPTIDLIQSKLGQQTIARINALEQKILTASSENIV